VEDDDSGTAVAADEEVDAEEAEAGSEEDEGAADEEAPAEHTASMTKALVWHLVPTGTGFIKAAPLAH